MSYCSPSNQGIYLKDKTCFDKKGLIELANAWNRIFTDKPKINNINKKTKKQLWDELNQRMTPICQGSGREWCWVDKLGKEKESIRPPIPSEWYTKPYAWLSNFDIEAVMKQYAEDERNLYAFLGVQPIDFAAKNVFGTCTVSDLCNFNLMTYIDKGIKYLGLITNLDRHDQSGSHWTSTFACIDPNSSCFGAYYYDSVGQGRAPKEIIHFMNKVLKVQAENYAQSIGIKRKFITKVNIKQHQHGNTECGVFSMAYQIRWIRMLQQKPDAKFEDVIQINIDDDDIHQLRNILFRPNTRVELAKNDKNAKKLKNKK